MDYTTLEVTLADGIATIELNRPDKANAMTLRCGTRSGRRMEWLDDTPAARVGIIAGEGKYFTAGIDLALLAGSANRSATNARAAAAKSCAG